MTDEELRNKKAKLQKELREVEEILQNRLKDEQQEHRDRVRENASALLKVVVKHDRTSCSDENPINATRAGCTRCCLIQAINENFVDFDLDICAVQTSVNFAYHP